MSLPLPDPALFEPQPLTGQRKRICPATPMKASLRSPFKSSKPRDIPYIAPDSPYTPYGQHPTLDLTLRDDHLIGGGSFSRVFESTCIQNGEKYAVKKITLDKLAIEQATNEIDVFQKLTPHPNIVRYIASGYVPSEKNLSICIELCQSNLEEYLTGTFTEEEIWPMFLDILLAVQHMHFHSFLHLDIKPTNILVSQNHSQRIIMKLADFGTTLPIGANQKRFTTLHYQAPEIKLQKKLPSTASDIFSCGVTFAEIAKIGTRYNVTYQSVNRSVIWEDVKEGLSGRSEEMQNLIQRMLEPDRRFRFDEIEKIIASSDTLTNLLKQRKDDEPVFGRFESPLSNFKTPLKTFGTSVDSNLSSGRRKRMREASDEYGKASPARMFGFSSYVTPIAPPNGGSSFGDSCDERFGDSFGKSFGYESPQLENKPKHGRRLFADSDSDSDGMEDLEESLPVGSQLKKNCNRRSPCRNQRTSW